MAKSQYTILARNRPVRIAFLIDTSAVNSRGVSLDALVDKIVDFNNIRWGGRTNPIIFYSGDDLGVAEWRLLELADPDCIQAFSPLSPQLLKGLDQRLHPWSIEVSERNDPDGVPLMSGEIGGVGVPPTPKNLARLRMPMNALVGREEKLLLFEFSQDCETDIKRFIHRNFGTYFQWIDPNTKSNQVRREAWLERLIPKIGVHSIPISDRKSLAAALTEMAGRFAPPNMRPGLSFIAPYQLASIGLNQWQSHHFRPVYQLVVGDAVKDFADFWSDIFWSRNWLRTHEGQLWVPASLISDPEFIEALLDWLRRYTGMGSNDRRVEPFSNSLPAEEIEKIRQSLQSVRPPIFTAKLSQNWREDRRADVEKNLAGPGHFIPWTADREPIRFTGFGDEERFSIPPPDLLDDDLNGSGNWMTDVQVEHHSRFRQHPREQSWWVLPRRNGAGLVQAIFRAPARINRELRFSVSVGSQNQFPAPLTKPDIKLSLPEDQSVIRWLLRDPFGQPSFTSDIRYKTGSRASVISGMRVSEKGANLSGLVELFGDFWTAESFCERRFWRHLFSILAGQGPSTDEKLRFGVKSLIKREAYRDALGAEEKAAALTNSILHMVRGRFRGRSITFKDALQLRSKLEKEPPPEPLVCQQGKAVSFHHGLKPLSFEEMREGLDLLIDLGVLRLGIEIVCPACKVPAWYHVDDLQQQVMCFGCGHKHSIGATEHWSYTLNTLAQTSVSQGVFGVLYALTALASRARTFFVFSPSLEVFRESEKGPWHELDVLCVVDGDFVIGEVKEGFVQKSAFDELAEIAEALLPQRAIIFLPFKNVQEQMGELRAWLAETQTRLAPKGVSAEIFALPEY